MSGLHTMAESSAVTAGLTVASSSLEAPLNVSKNLLWNSMYCLLWRESKRVSVHPLSLQEQRERPLSNDAHRTPHPNNHCPIPVHKNKLTFDCGH
jgi:hypothetical protein